MSSIVTTREEATTTKQVFVTEEVGMATALKELLDALAAELNNAMHVNGPHFLEGKTKATVTYEFDGDRKCWVGVLTHAPKQAPLEEKEPASSSPKRTKVSESVADDIPATMEIPVPEQLEAPEPEASQQAAESPASPEVVVAVEA